MTRREFTSKFKTKMVLEALKERQTTQELAQKFDITPQQINLWKREFLSEAEAIFDKGTTSKKSEPEQKEDQLLKTFGVLKVENDFLALKPLKERRLMISKDHSKLSVVKQSSLLQIHRSGLYYRIMGLRAIMPGKHASKRNKAHKIYPYLLRNLKIDRPNQVWAIDITYIPMRKEFMYLVAIIDLRSRYVLNWSVSNTNGYRLV